MADHENRSGGSERPARSGDRPAPGDVTINQPDVAAEVTDCFDAYDNALISNDVAALDRWFWAAPQAVRYGLGEELYGYDAIAQHRRNLPGGVIRGPLTRQTVTTFGTDMAIVCAEFDENGRPGRQTQTWIRRPEGWRIVCGHVSIR
jgi:Protein of unknown function (DUF3225)